MDRRSFMAGCAGLSLSAIAEDAFGAPGPLTKMNFPLSPGGGRDTLSRLEAEYAGHLAEFLPWLRAARWVGVGRQTVWGKGDVRVL